MQYIYSIPYSGNIEQIDAGRIQSYSVREEGKIADIYHIQQDRIADAGLDVTVLAPAAAGGLIVRCAPKEAQAVYDAVFGGSYKAAPKARATADVVEFTQQKETGVSSLSSAFDYAAKRFHVGEIFSRAAAAPAIDNDNRFVPQLKIAA